MSLFVILKTIENLVYLSPHIFVKQRPRILIILQYVKADILQMIFCSPRSFNRKAQQKVVVPPKGRHLSLFQQLDLFYINTREAICNTEFYRATTRHVKARLYNWFQKLDHIIIQQEWKRNRNNYIKLLNLMCQCEVIDSPFDGFPPEGELPWLKTFQINEVIDSVERVVNKNIQKYGECLDCHSHSEFYKKEKGETEVLQGEWDCARLDDLGDNSQITNYFSVHESNIALATKKQSFVKGNCNEKQNQSARSNPNIKQNEQMINNNVKHKLQQQNKESNRQNFISWKEQLYHSDANHKPMDLDTSVIDIIAKSSIEERRLPPKPKKPKDKGKQQKYIQSHKEQFNWQKSSYNELIGQIKPKVKEYFLWKKQPIQIPLTLMKQHNVNLKKQPKIESSQTSRQTCMIQFSGVQEFKKDESQNQGKKSIISTNSIYLLEDRASKRSSSSISHLQL